MPVIKIGAAHVYELFRLVFDCLHDFGMAMAGRTNGDTGVAVKENVAVNVLHPHPLGAFGDQFEGRARISRINELSIGCDYRLALWSRQRGLDFRSFQCDCG